MEINIALLQMLGSLADEDKFKIVATISLGNRSLKDIVNNTGLEGSKIIKILARLEKAGLIENREDDSYHYRAKGLKDLYFELSRTTEHKPAQSQLDRFLRDGRLLSFPKSHEDRLLVLEHLANTFEFDRRYTETEVNIQLGMVHADYAALRRYLVDYGFLARESVTKDEHSVMFYWRPGRS
jgi:hypothetical protein